jgi:hypothetical protein
MTQPWHHEVDGWNSVPPTELHPQTTPEDTVLRDDDGIFVRMTETYWAHTSDVWRPQHWIRQEAMDNPTHLLGIPRTDAEFDAWRQWYADDSIKGTFSAWLKARKP